VDLSFSKFFERSLGRYKGSLEVHQEIYKLNYSNRFRFMYFYDFNRLNEAVWNTSKGQIVPLTIN